MLPTLLIEDSVATHFTAPVEVQAYTLVLVVARIEDAAKS
jgi:hypothetical protein